MKPTPPFVIWNEAVDMTGYGRRASASDGAHALKKLRGELGAKFDSLWPKTHESASALDRGRV